MYFCELLQDVKYTKIRLEEHQLVSWLVSGLGISRKCEWHITSIMRNFTQTCKHKHDITFSYNYMDKSSIVN